MNENLDNQESDLVIHTSILKHRADMDTPSTELKRIRDSLSNVTKEPANFTETLLSVCNVLEFILKNQQTEYVEDYSLKPLPKGSDENNFDLDYEGVKNIIQNEISIGQVFYPSDVADKYNLDLRTVMSVISDLIKDGKMAEKT